MKLLISFITAVNLGLACTVLGDDNYSALAAQGYRWVTVDGPYACNTEQDAERITAHHTDATELQVVENIQCYYLIPGTIVQVIKEDPSSGYVEDTLRKHHQVFMDLQPIPQQASGSGHLWGY